MTGFVALVKRGGMVLLAAGLCLVASGCFKNRIVVKVKPDGTGTIVVTQIFTKEIVAMVEAQMKEMREQLADNPGMDIEEHIPKDPFYNEREIKKAAGKFGPGVKLLRSVKYERDGELGFVAIYAFDNINEIYLNLEMDVGSVMGGQFNMDDDDDDEIEVKDKGEYAFEFKLTQEGGVNVLAVTVPKYPDAPAFDADEEIEDEEAFPVGGGEMQQIMAMGNPFGFTGQETQAEAFQKMMMGLAEDLVVEIESAEQESDAIFKNDGGKGAVRYTLLSMRMSEIIGAPEGAKKMRPDVMQEYFMGSPAGMYSFLDGIPGMELQNKDFTIKFK